jgi:LysM repeat protein
MKSLQLLVSSLVARLAGAYIVAPRETPASGTRVFARAVEAPSPVQPGMVAGCNKFHLVASGDYCSKIVSNYGINLQDFYSWNPTVGESCAGLWLGYYVCVGVETPATPTTTTPPATTTAANGVVTPTPIRDGMTPICQKFHYAVSGDNCWDLQSKYNMTMSEFYRMNPVILESCGGLWPGYYYCIAEIPGVPNPTTVHTPPPTPIVTPEPADMMVPYCNKFHLAEEDGECPDVEGLYGIAQWQFIRWNYNVWTACRGVDKGYWYCVGIY